MTPEQRRRHYEQNIHRERQRSKDYRERNKEYVKAYQQQYRAANRDRRKEHQRKYREANRDKRPKELATRKAAQEMGKEIAAAMTQDDYSGATKFR